LSVCIEKIQIPSGIDPFFLFGQHDTNLKNVRDSFFVEVGIVKDEIWIKGESEENVINAKSFFMEIISMLKIGKTPDEMELEYLFDKYLNQENIKNFEDRECGLPQLGPRGLSKQVLGGEKGFYSTLINDENSQLKTVKVRPKTEGQAKYVETMKENDLVFSIGPAGTGKTYLAVAMAVEALRCGTVQRIILARPAVEAGERLGFLPGTLVEKVDPYLRPLLDSMYDMIPPEKVQYLREKQVIEIVPLAYMRGRTLNNSFIILDEAQNTTHQQMKMFLTRIGFYSKAVITGDITQIDLAKDMKSGLVECQTILKGVLGISFVYLHKQDVIRHPLVKKIIDAYEIFENNEK